MKKIIKGSLFFIAMLITFSGMAQSKKATVSQSGGRFGKVVSSLNNIDANNTVEVKKIAGQFESLEEAIDASLKELYAAAATAKKEIEQKETKYIPTRTTKTRQLDNTLLPIISDIPEPVSSLPEAKKIMKGPDEDNIFSHFIEKAERLARQMQEAAREAMPADLKDKDKMESEARRQAKQSQNALAANPMIQQMGGMEKLKNMSPAEREAMVKQMRENVKQNPYAYTTNNDPRKLFAQKMMTDASYAARYNHMNQQQQQEEYAAFLADNGFENTATAAGNEKSKAERDNTVTAIAIDKRIGDILLHMQEMSGIAGGFQKATDDYYADVQRKMDKQYADYVEALPLTEHGEAGKSKDTYRAEIAFSIAMNPVNASHAISNKEIFKRYVQALKVTVAEYNELLSEYWGKDKATDLLMAKRNLTPAAISYAICNELIGLAKLAKFFTSTHATWQRSYDERVLHIYE